MSGENLIAQSDTLYMYTGRGAEIGETRAPLLHPEQYTMHHEIQYIIPVGNTQAHSLIRRDGITCVYEERGGNRETRGDEQYITKCNISYQ